MQTLSQKQTSSPDSGSQQCDVTWFDRVVQGILMRRKVCMFGREATASSLSFLSLVSTDIQTKETEL